MLWRLYQLRIGREHPLWHLCARLRFYPLVQVLCRLFASWRELNWDPETQIEISNRNSNYKNTIIILDALTRPSAGICYFLIFVYLTPDAVKMLRELIMYFFSSCQANKQNQQNQRMQEAEEEEEADLDKRLLNSHSKPFESMTEDQLLSHTFDSLHSHRPVSIDSVSLFPLSALEF